MDRKKIANLTLNLGIIVLALAVLIRLGNVWHVFAIRIHDLWELSAALLLISIAASVAKD